MMQSLPQDPFILLSYINTKLRDNYKSLDELCYDLDIDSQELTSRLSTVGVVYDPVTNQFR